MVGCAWSLRGPRVGFSLAPRCEVSSPWRLRGSRSLALHAPSTARVRRVLARQRRARKARPMGRRAAVLVLVDMSIWQEHSAFGARRRRHAAQALGPESGARHDEGLRRRPIPRLARPARTTPRFVVTDLPLMPEAVYAVYRQRGDVENRHKEAHGRSWGWPGYSPRFWARRSGVCRLLMAIVYILFQTLQQQAQGRPPPARRSPR